MSPSKEVKEVLQRERQIRARALYESGYTIGEIAKVLNLSESGVKAILKIKKEKNND